MDRRKVWKRTGALLLCMALLFFPTTVYAADIKNAEPAAMTGEKTEPTSATDEKSESTVKLTIDNQNRYEGMNSSYSDGYVPRVENGQAWLVVPLLCEQELKDNRLRVSLNLGDSASAPFVGKNYERSIGKQANPVNDGAGTVEGYLISFALELKGDRYNGSYPVGVRIQAVDQNGNDVSAEFSVMVTITDGKDPNAEPTTEATTEEPVVFAPKVLVESCKVSGENLMAGDEMTATITLKNTSTSESVQNMVVTVASKEDAFILKSASDSVYVGTIPAGGIAEVAFDYQIPASVPEGQYELLVSMDYADIRGTSYSGSGNAMVMVGQPMKVQFDPIVIADHVQVGDVTEASFQAMNLGRTMIYNVRAEIMGDGLNPDGTLFIGDMEAGSVKSVSGRVVIGGLTEGTSLYGATTGTVTYYYEDADGKEYTETAEFTVTIESPFTDQETQEPDQTGQWWIIMAVLTGVIVVVVVILLIQRSRGKREQEGTDADEMVEDLPAESETK